jgi:hypothetical protein
MKLCFASSFFSYDFISLLYLVVAFNADLHIENSRYSAENQATHDSTSVNGATLQDMEVFSFFLSFRVIGIIITLKIWLVWRYLLCILILT